MTNPMSAQKYHVLRAHASEYPQLITFAKGALLSVGKRYEGHEDWNDWYFCDISGQQGGWVPSEIIDIDENRVARAREDYTARELKVDEGEVVIGSRALGGWIWCENPVNTQSGWVPLACLEVCDKSRARDERRA